MRETDVYSPGGSPPWLADDAPWWARLLIYVICWLGPTVVVAGVFLAMWAGWVPSPITENNRMLHEIQGTLNRSIEDTKSETSRSHTSDENSLRVLLLICRNTARDSQQAARCDDYWKR